MSRWPIKPILRAADLTARRVQVFSGQRPYVSTGGVDENGIASTMTVSFGERPTRADLTAKAGDVLFARMQATNKVIIVTKSNEDHLWSTGFAALRPKPGTDSRWLAYWLASPYFNERKDSLCTGATQKAITNGGIHDLEMPLPPLPEQERMVRIINEASELQRLRNEADDHTRNITAALFDGMIGNPSLNPMGWDETTLGELGTIVTGNTPPRSDPSLYGDFIEWIKTDNIDPIRGIVRPSSERLSETGAKCGRIVPPGSLLISCIAGSIDCIGNAAITDRKVAINQQINAIVPHDNVESLFVSSLVRTIKPIIQNRATGVMTRIINKTELERVPAVCPPPPLQKKFAARVGEIRNLEEKQATSREHIDSLFRSLAHNAFQGTL